MEILFSNIYVFLYFAMYLLVFVYIRRKRVFKENMNATNFLLAYYTITALLSLLYFNASNGFFRDYRNVSLLPYVYLVICFMITLYPVYAYDKRKQPIPLLMPERKKKILQVVIVFLVLCTLLPFFESLFQIPSAFATENSLADAYETRLAGNVSDYLSSPGRKFFAIIWMFNNVIPVLIFVAIINKLDKRLIVGLCIALVTIWIHSMVLGGRSKLVQNALYIFLVYFFFKGYLSPAMNKKIVAFGSVFMSIALVAVIAVSISRFNTIWLDSTSSMTLWSWLGLYAGEGALNFNCREWNMPGSSDYIIGYATLIVPLSLFSGNIISVFDIWNMKSKLGIPGNQFYTYVGAIFMDYGKFGTLLFLLFFSTVMYFMVIKSSILSGGKRLLFLSLWAKILVVGPIFYTYSTYGDQMNLLWACIFGILFL